MAELGGDDRRRHRQVGRRLLHPQAAGDVEIDVARAHHKAAARLEHGQQHGQPAAVPADHGAARRGRAPLGATRAWISTSSGRRALHAGEHGGARDALLAVGQEQGRGVGHRHQARLGHLEHADLVGRAEAVLDRAQDAELVAALALEVEHGVDHVLEHARAGDLPVLGDVADQQEGAAALLGEADQGLGGGAQLGDRAGRLLEPVDPHGLDRIDDHQVRRLRPVERGQDVAGRGGAGELDRRVGEAEPAGAQPDLVDRFLAGDIDDRAALDGQRGGRLQHQRGLADAGIAADQDRRARRRGRRPAPGRARRCRWRRRGGGVGRCPSSGTSSSRRPCALPPAPGAGLAAASSTMLFQAPQSSQRPAQRGVGGAAALADEGALRLGHQAPIAAGADLDRALGAAVDELVDVWVAAVVDRARPGPAR